MALLRSAILVSLGIMSSEAHSWVRCAKYAGTITGGDYNPSQCQGWIRDWTFNNIAFGQDRGINHQVGVGSGNALCQAALDGSSSNRYAADYQDMNKLTRYTVGENVRVVWPAKNHANYECSSFIPDTSMKLFMNPNVNPTSDLPNTASSMTGNGWKLVKDWHEGCTPGTDGCGFQNCPKFCANTDRATCFQDFVVPSVSQSGYYTFAWYWIFNPGSPYVSCWEAYISADGSNPGVLPPPVPTPRPTAPVTGGGGDTGNGNGGNGIKVVLQDGISKYYLSFLVTNIGDCEDQVQSAQMWQANAWKGNDQKWHMWGQGPVFGFNYQHPNTFDNFLPISIRLQLSNGQYINIRDVITNLNAGSSFSSSSTCRSAASGFFGAQSGLIGEDGGALTAGDDGDDGQQLSEVNEQVEVVETELVLLIIVICLLVVMVVAGFVTFCVFKNKHKVAVSFNHSAAVADDVEVADINKEAVSITTH